MMWSWTRVRARAASPASTASRIAWCSRRRRSAAASQSAMRGAPGLDVRLDRRAQARHHRGDDDVARRLGEREVQLRVEREELRRREVGGVHRVEDRRAPGSSSSAGSVATRVDDGGLEHEAGRDDVVEREALRGDLQPQQRRHAALGRRDDDRAGCRARAGAGADESHHLEHAQRLADAGAADAEGGGELALGREPVARARACRRAGRSRSARARRARRAPGRSPAAASDSCHGSPRRCRIRLPSSMKSPVWSDHDNVWSDHRQPT